MKFAKDNEPIPTQIIKAILKVGISLVALYVLVYVTSFVTIKVSKYLEYTHCNSYVYDSGQEANIAYARNITANGKRGLGIQNMQLFLKMYYEKAGGYPVVTDGSAPERIDKLEEGLRSQGFDIPGNLFDDPCFERNPNYQLSYGTDDLGSDFVVKAVMSDQYPASSTERVYGEVYGLWCGDSDTAREYCERSRYYDKEGRPR